MPATAAGTPPARSPPRRLDGGKRPGPGHIVGMTDTAAVRHVLDIHPWDAPHADGGHDLRGEYVERFWLPILGPSTLVLVRRIARGLDHAPGGFRIDLELTAAALGLGTAQGKKGPLPRALHRAQTFGFARPVGTDKVAFRTRAATLTVRQLERLPHIVQAAHEGFAEPATVR